MYPPKKLNYSVTTNELLRLATFGTKPAQRQVNRFCFESRLAGGCLDKFRRFGQLEVHQLAAVVADRVIVTFGLAIVAAGAVAKIDFVNEAGCFQVAQRVVDGGVTDAGQAAPGRLENVAGGGVILAFADHLENCFPLRGQFRVAGFPCAFYVGRFHNGLRLILSLGSCQARVGFDEVDNPVDVSFEARALDSVWLEKGLRLRRIVKLLHEEIGHG